MPRFENGQHVRRPIKIVAGASLFEDRNHGVIQTAAMDRFEQCKSDVGYRRRPKVGGRVTPEAERSHCFLAILVSMCAAPSCWCPLCSRSLAGARQPLSQPAEARA